MRPVRLRRKSVLINLALATAVVAGAGFAYSAVGDEGGSSTSSGTRTGKVTKGTVMATVSASGSLSSPSDVGVEFTAAGEVAAVGVKVGDTVRAGQVLARIDPSQAQAAVDTAQAEVDVAEADLADAKAGTPVQTGSGSSGGGANTQNSVLRETTSGTTTGTTTTTGTPTGTTGGTSGGTKGGSSDGTTNSTSGSTGTTGTNKPTTGGTSSTGGKLPSASASATPAPPKSATPPDQTPATVTVTITRTATATPSPSTSVDAAQVTKAQAALAQAQTKLTQAQEALAGCVLKAPSAGIVASVGGKVGDSVSGSSSSSSGSSGSSGSSTSGGSSSTGGGGQSTSSSSTVSGFVVLANPTGMETKVSFSEADATKVKAGQPATVTLNVDSTTTLNAHVVSVNPLPDAGATSGSVKYSATIALDGDVSKLRTGQTANISVVVAQAENALQVPSAAVTGTGATASVRVLANGVEQRRTVTAGVVGDQTTEIASGLAEGDEIVVGTTTTGSGTSGSSRSGGTTGLSGGTTGGGGGGGGGAAPGGGFPGGGAR